MNRFLLAAAAAVVLASCQTPAGDTSSSSDTITVYNFGGLSQLPAVPAESYTEYTAGDVEQVWNYVNSYNFQQGLRSARGDKPSETLSAPSVASVQKITPFGGQYQTSGYTYYSTFWSDEGEEAGNFMQSSQGKQEYSDEFFQASVRNEVDPTKTYVDAMTGATKSQYHFEITQPLSWTPYGAESQVTAVGGIDQQIQSTQSWTVLGLSGEKASSPESTSTISGLLQTSRSASIAFYNAENGYGARVYLSAIKAKSLKNADPTVASDDPRYAETQLVFEYDVKLYAKDGSLIGSQTFTDVYGQNHMSGGSEE